MIVRVLFSIHWMGVLVWEMLTAVNRMLEGRDQMVL
jgi:hypothetical protein